MYHFRFIFNVGIQQQDGTDVRFGVVLSYGENANGSQFHSLTTRI